MGIVGYKLKRSRSIFKTKKKYYVINAVVETRFLGLLVSIKEVQLNSEYKRHNSILNYPQKLVTKKQGKETIRILNTQL